MTGAAVRGGVQGNLAWSHFAHHPLHIPPCQERLYQVAYEDIIALRRELDWRSKEWVSVLYPGLEGGKPIWVGDGSQALAVELLSGIVTQGL